MMFESPEKAAFAAPPNKFPVPPTTPEARPVVPEKMPWANAAGLLTKPLRGS